MQRMKAPTTDNQLLKDSRDFAVQFVPFQRAPQNSEDYSVAFLAGAEQVLKYLEEFVLKVEVQVPLERASEFERGQLDGMRWALDSLRTLNGQD